MKAREVQQFRSVRWANRWARVIARQQGHVLYELWETRPKRSMELPPERIGTYFRATEERFAALYPPGFIASARTHSRDSGWLGPRTTGWADLQEYDPPAQLRGGKREEERR